MIVGRKSGSLQKLIPESTSQYAMNCNFLQGSLARKTNTSALPEDPETLEPLNDDQKTPNHPASKSEIA